ncbi:MAG: helix-turn-helix transcriptional regulator [Clostridiales bacterium]|nr:helix-turn-helix transcriptional regulator [Clostridiales bacterium]
MTLNYNKLWKLMIDKRINKTQLREKAGITTNELAKLGRNETVKMETLLKICSVMKCEIDDIVEYSTKKED